MKSMFNLSNLIKFLHKTLVLTEDVKNVLRSNCNEALFCLKPWCMEVISQQEISRDACICYKTESEVEEIAAGISRTLLQTQQLREQLSLNVVAEKKPNCFRMYEYSQANDSVQEVIAKTDRARSKNSKQDCDSIKASRQNLDKRFQNEIATSEDMKSKEAKNHNKQSVALPSVSRENKNFLAINKKSIKNMVKTNQHKDTYYELENKLNSSNSTMEQKCVKFVAKRTAALTNELKHLIQKISNESNDASTFKECHMKCPLHGDSPALCTNKSNLLSMNVVESVSMTHIPAEIIQSLKVYHAYLNIEHSTKSANKKQQKEQLHKFLTEFRKMDNVVQERITTKNCNMNTLHKFVSLCHPLFSKHLDISKLTDIKAMYAELNPTCKVYEVDKLTSRQILKSNQINFMTNGIWNDHSSSLEGTSKVCCIRYKKKDQLLLFYDMMQKLLYTQYHIKLIKIIEEDLLPYMQKSFDYTQSEYVQIYKMLLILHQGLKSHVPVLVKTDK